MRARQSGTYYDRNRERILAGLKGRKISPDVSSKLKARYAGDPVYRAAVKARTKARHAQMMATDAGYREKHAMRIAALKETYRGMVRPQRARIRVALANKRHRLRLREEMFARYGDVCACCLESDREFLTLDHIGGGGSKHRRMLKSGGVMSVYADLKKRGWPKDGFRVLCMNCNWATRLGAVCPHQRTRGVDPGVLAIGRGSATGESMLFAVNAQPDSSLGVAV